MAKRGHAVRGSPTGGKAPTKRQREPENVDLERENAALKRDLAEALEQQTATSEVLQIVSSSPGDLEPVFKSMLENATRICGANFGQMNLYEEGRFRPVALCNVPAAYAAWVAPTPFQPHPQSGLGTVARTHEVVHIEDIRTLPPYLEGNPSVVAIADLAGARTYFVVPMLKENELIGAITIHRQEVKPFTEKQIELVANFAKQAVIAIENTRLLNELRQRTDDLKESLEQQTATSEVLQVISSTPGELEPVFQSMLANATRICEASIGILFRYENGAYTAIATLGVTPAYAEYLNRGPIRPGPTTGLGRVASTKQTIHIVDTKADETYSAGEPLRRATAELGGARSLLNVPMLKGDDLIGAFGIFRQEVKPFTDKQIELVTNFAAQAVIAIENTRLLKELRESLQQQTATADVLKVISRSRIDLQTVLDTLVESAVRLCEANIGQIALPNEAGYFQTRAHCGFTAELREELERIPFQPGRESVTGRALLERKTVQILDAQTDPEYKLSKAQRLGGYRSLIGTPLLREGVPIGVFGLSRNSVRPFTDKQMVLLTTFSDQAVIAIENARLFDEVQAKTRDLSEALTYQTGSSKVLGVIASSPTDVGPVLKAIVESACELCEAYDAVVRLRDDDNLRLGAHHGPIPITLEKWPISRDWVAGRSVLDKKPIHVRDIQSAEGDEFPGTRELARHTGNRSFLCVPLLREGESIGTIVLRRTEVHPFSDKQIALLQTFADQAVIAIENVRLFDAVQARTLELSESLEQQTATSEVLEVISASAGDLEPVFQKMLENATRICGANFGTMGLFDGDSYQNVALYNVPPAFAETPQKFRPHPKSGVATATRNREAFQVEDIRTQPPYLEGDPAVVAISDRAGARTVVNVPMLRENEPIGAITIYRKEVRPFSTRQIDLLANFAKQVVIAIENTRLLKELRESLQQQTATSDVLKVISRSAFDLQTVLDTLVESAGRLCDADEGTIFQPKDDAYYLTASCGLSPRRKEFLENCSFQPGTDTTIGRVLLEGKTVHIEDSQTDPNYQFQDPEVRTRLGVPLLRERAPIGVFVLTRRDVRPFSDKQIELVQTFADQAVIAIENARLFNETKEALERQTATADILKVIASSPDDVQPVFEAIAERSNRLVNGLSTAVFSVVDDAVHLMSFTSINATADAALKAITDVPLSAFPVGEAMRKGEIAQIADTDDEATPDFLRDVARLRGWRSSLTVPMLREGILIGIIAVTRVVPGLFDDHHVQLLKTFADQAMIAISNVGLFNEVQDRTRKLSQSLDDLRAAQDRLVQTEKLASLGQLTAGIAHEIKNPLNFVNNFSALSVELVDELHDVLKPAPLDNKTRVTSDELTHMLKSNLEKVVQHGKRADLIVKNMLLHSREGSSERRLVNLNGLVEECLNLAYHGARAENQQFKMNLERFLDPTIGRVDLFPQEMTRVLLNLISNGFYATTKRKAETKLDGYEPTLAAATRNLGDRVEIKIRDNGGGIPTEVMDKIFNPFFTTKPPGEGTGLGLSLSHDIVVKQHAGSIEVDTRPGEFTEFKVILPRVAATSKAGADK